MEYKNMREIYKGNICEIRTPDFIGSDRFGDYQFKFDKTMVIGSNTEYMFIKDGCYLYEIISGYVFPFLKHYMKVFMDLIVNILMFLNMLSLIIYMKPS